MGVGPCAKMTGPRTYGDQTLKFTKMHGAGNDYIYLDARGEERDWPSLAVAMSDRHRGVGSDGIILLLPSTDADARMVMFNADGSEGMMCGNGIRCFVKYAMDREAVSSDAASVDVETASGVLKVTPCRDNGVITRASVSMGEPRLRPEEIPVRVDGAEAVLDYPLEVAGQHFKINCVSMGNPHAVAFLDESVDEVPLHEIGPEVEHHPLFPERVNFEIANVVDTGRLKVRVWERGSGLTMACGTGACAAAVAARIHGLVGDDTVVGLPGGDLRVRWTGQGTVVLDGPIEDVFSGEWPTI